MFKWHIQHIHIIRWNLTASINVIINLFYYANQTVVSNSFKDRLKQQWNYMLEPFILCAVFLYLPLTLSQKLFIVFVSFSRYVWPFPQSIGLIDKPPLHEQGVALCCWKGETWCLIPLFKHFFLSFFLAAGICTDFSFKCKNKECVNKVNAECDRENDCADGSDEQGCGKSDAFLTVKSCCLVSLLYSEMSFRAVNTDFVKLFI